MFIIIYTSSIYIYILFLHSSTIRIYIFVACFSGISGISTTVGLLDVRLESPQDLKSGNRIVFVCCKKRPQLKYRGSWPQLVAGPQVVVWFRWTTPWEKNYANRENGWVKIFPKYSGWNFQKYLSCEHLVMVQRKTHRIIHGETFQNLKYTVCIVITGMVFLGISDFGFSSPVTEGCQEGICSASWLFVAERNLNVIQNTAILP